MSLRKIAIGFTMALASFSNSYAGPEDWNGTFTIIRTDGNQYTVRHTPDYARFLSITAGGCIRFAKGSNINDVETLDDVKLCKVSNIEEFTKEVEKLGTIIDKIIDVGSTYSIETNR